MSSRDAQMIAREQGVDLVEISANADPPVVKVIDWGKYQYQKMKEEAKNRKKAREKQSELKTMKVGLKISDNDLNIKVRKIRSFLEDGDRVKIMDAKWRIRSLGSKCSTRSSPASPKKLKLSKRANRNLRAAIYPSASAVSSSLITSKLS